MLNHDLIKNLDLKKPYIWLATWFGSGLMAKAPGTWGTLAGLPFAILLSAIGGWPLLLAGIVILSVIGFWAADRFEKDTDIHDSGSVVIDEVVGIAIAFLPLALSPLMIIIGFVIFRAFDILKPWPVSWCDRQNGALGVMLDDMAAGILTALVIWGLQYAGLG